MHFAFVGHTNLQSRVRKMMARNSLSQRELARQLNMSQGHLSKILGGKQPGRKTIGLLEDWLNSKTTASKKRGNHEQELKFVLEELEKSSPQVMHFVVQLMHLVLELCNAPTENND